MIAAVLLLALAGAAQAQPRGRHFAPHAHHHHHRRGGVALGFGLGLGFGPWWPYGAYGAYGPYPPYWGYPVAVPAMPLEPAVVELPPPSAPDPVFVAQRGQDAQRTEADRRDCNRWTMTQPGTLTDAETFQRTTLACMRARGYEVR